MALEWIEHAYDQGGTVQCTVILGELEPGREWCKAEAVRAGLDASTADVIVIADADCWSSFVEAAVDQLVGFPWAMPFKDVHRLSPEATSHALQTGELNGKLQQRPYLGVPGGGMMVLPRESYERVPLDPRFRGWGQEDEAWGAALGSVFGKGWRGSEPLWHLWHPPQARQNRAVGSDASRHLRNLYLKARRFPDQMDELLTVARATL